MPTSDDPMTVKDFRKHRADMIRQFRTVNAGLSANSNALQEINARLDRNDLNGSAANLREIGKLAPVLVELAEKAGSLLALAAAAPALVIVAQGKVAAVESAAARKRVLQDFADLLRWRRYKKLLKWVAALATAAYMGHIFYAGGTPGPHFPW